MRQSLKSSLYRAAATAGRAARTVGFGRCDVAVLIYHSIADLDGTATLPPRLFQEQIRWLHDHFEIVSLDAALALRRVSDTVVVLTFDDGYEDYLTAAFPFLLKHGLPSTVYVITDLLGAPGEGFPFESGRSRQPLSARQVEQLAREELVTIGSHSHRHRRLVGQPEGVVEDELATSRKVLSGLLGLDELHFAFPWGVGDSRARRAARRHFRSVAVAGSRGNRSPMDPFRILRIPIKREDMGLFAHRVRGDLALEGLARSLRDRIVPGRGGDSS